MSAEPIAEWQQLARDYPELSVFLDETCTDLQARNMRRMMVIWDRVSWEWNAIRERKAAEAGEVAR